MEEDFVSYDLAVKLKEKGFREKCKKHCYPNSQDWFISSMPECDNFSNYLDIPTIYQVLKWLREEKNLHIEIVSAAYGYIYIVSDTPIKGGTDRVNSRYRGRNDGGAWDDYNECVLDAIKYVIYNLI